MIDQASLKQSFEEADALKKAIAELEHTISAHQRKHIAEQLEAVNSVSRLRPVIQDLLMQARSFADPRILEFGEQAADAPLFHPLYEELLLEQQKAGDEATFYAQQQVYLLEELQVYQASPFPEEHNILRLLYGAHADRTAEVEAAYDQHDIHKLYMQLHEDKKESIALNTLYLGIRAQVERLQDSLQIMEESPLAISAIHDETGAYEAEFLALAQLMGEVREALEESVAQQKTTDRLKKLVEAVESETDHLFSYPLAMPSIDEDDPDYGFRQFYGMINQGQSVWKSTDEGRFKKGVAVSISSEYPDGKAFGFTDTTAWQGRILQAYTDGKTYIYELMLDSITIQSLPIDFIKAKCINFDDSFAIHTFEEEELSIAEARDTQEEAYHIYRQFFNRFFWGDIEQDPAARRMHRILNTIPEGTDLENWEAYFKEHVAFPFKAILEGVSDFSFTPDTLVEVLSLEQTDEEGEGLMVKIKDKKQTSSAALIELLPYQEDTETGAVLLAYRHWADHML
jgi:hypothetical protein